MKSTRSELMKKFSNKFAERKVSLDSVTLEEFFPIFSEYAKKLDQNPIDFLSELIDHGLIFHANSHPYLGFDNTAHPSDAKIGLIKAKRELEKLDLEYDISQSKIFIQFKQPTQEYIHQVYIDRQEVGKALRQYTGRGDYPWPGLFPKYRDALQDPGWSLDYGVRLIIDKDYEQSIEGITTCSTDEKGISWGDLHWDLYRKIRSAILGGKIRAIIKPDNLENMEPENTSVNAFELISWLFKSSIYMPIELKKAFEEYKDVNVGIINGSVNLVESEKEIGGDKKTSISTSINSDFPSDTEWKNMTWTFLSNELVRVEANGVTKKYRYSDLGFTDNRKGDATDTRWAILSEFAKNNGEITWKTNIKSKEKNRMTAAIRDIRKRLKDFFNIDDNPIHHYRKTRSYKTKFTIKDKRDIDNTNDSEPNGFSMEEVKEQLNNSG